MSGELLRKHPGRIRAVLVVLFISGLLLALFASSLPPTSRAKRGPQEARGSGGAGGGGKNSKAEFVPGEVLVRYRTEALAKQQTLLAAPSGMAGQTVMSERGRGISVRLERFEGSNIVPGLRIARVAAADTLEAIEALRKQPNVVYAEPNYLLYVDVTNPNDPRFLSNELYGLTKIGAPLAWDTTQGSASVVVGVIDEGIDRVHQDLQANIWINPADSTVDGIDNDGNGFIDDVNGYNFASNSGAITPDFHGTHVGGTIGAVGNNGIGVVGVNWNVRLMSLKFIAGGVGTTADAIRACNYAKQMRDLWVSSGGAQGANLRVLNNSYGGGGFSQSFFDAITGLNQSSILFVASAGNVTAGATEPNNEIVPHYPSSYPAPNVIGVANTDASDNLSSSSHFGSNTIHLGAPGSGILSTTPTNNYALSSGTSMASPHVAGSAALLLAQNPNLTIQQLKSLLIFNGDLAPALANKTVTGRRLNISKAVQALAENDTTPPGTVTNFQVNTQSGRSYNLGWTASGDDGATGQASLYRLAFTDSTTSAVIPLTNVLPAATATAQSVDIKLPYRHTAGTISLLELDNVGNVGTPAVLAVSVSAGLGDPYLTSLSSPAALSTGGTPLSLIGDDKFKLNQSLPFSFPFFGENFTALHVSTNGNLYFSAPPTRSNGDADDVPGSVVGLTQFKMISGLWDDLRTDRTAGDDVYMIADSNHVIFRWKGVTFGDGTPATEFPVNFEIELLPNGTIHTRYGAGNTNLFPVVGIGGGEPDAYDIPSHTSEQAAISLTNAQQVTFTPRGNSTLTVASSNPSSGVNISVTPTDNNNLGNGTTQFARTYGNGTLVNLTAPATAEGNNFLKWQRDGLDWATTRATSVTIDSNRTMTAVYVTPGTRALTVASSNPGSGVSITVTEIDNNGSSSGSTQFIRTYNEGTTVNLTAPATAGGNNFLKWQKDGADFVNNTSLATSVTMDTNHTMTAVYLRTLTVASSNPDSGVEITVTPSGNGGSGGNTTPFTRTYDHIVVNLTAPAMANGNNFVKWQKDGADFVNNTSLATSVTMDANHTMTAVYVTPRTLTVSSSNPSSGVSIAVTQNDNGGFSTGTTQFTRTYNEGTVVNLTAPASVAGNPFQKWQRDGVDWVTTPATSVTMDSPHTMTAVYIKIVQFTVPQFSAFEPSAIPCTGSPACEGSVTVTVSRSGDSTAPAASVDYTTSDGVAPANATQKGDYIFSAGKLNFAVGELSKSFKVLIVDDVYQEGTEKFQVILSNPVGTTLGVRSVANVQISDNDFSNGPNPLDNSDARFFVRQHYLDFLNREPDNEGLNFWRNEITSCGANQACIAAKRINVSAAFFLSIEFQETGYLVERLYKSAYGDATGQSTCCQPNTAPHPIQVPIVRYYEFLRDSQQISSGLIVGQPGWQQVLENNKLNFIAAFVARDRFTSEFPNTISANEFVNRLNANAGNPLSSSESATLITELGAGRMTRAQVLRAVAEDPDFRAAEDSRAFVLMQYFGYLRRNLNDAPDSDYSGYEFWLTKLNQFNGNYIGAEMVKAFIDSIEYRQRFAP